MAKQDAQAIHQARRWLEWILARKTGRSSRLCLRALQPDLCKRNVCLQLLPGETPDRLLSRELSRYLKEVAVKRSGLPAGVVPVGWLIVLPNQQTFCAYSTRHYPVYVHETAEKLDHFSEEGAKLLEKFASDTGRVSARLDEDTASLVLSNRRRVPLAECECRTLLTAKDLGVTTNPPPKRVIPLDDVIARRAVRLTRKLLRSEVDGIEPVQTYMFPGDDDRPAHDDQLQDRLTKDFQSALKSVQKELSKAFGKPLRSGFKSDRVIPLSGVFGFAIWNAEGRQVWAAVEHEDRELPYLLSVGTKLRTNKRKGQ
jgi:hypothetical protein